MQLKIKYLKLLIQYKKKRFIGQTPDAKIKLKDLNDKSAIAAAA